MNFPPPTEKQARLIWVALTGLAIGIILALIAGAVWGLGHVLQMLAPVLWPLAVAGVLAYLLDPVVDFFERRRLPRTRAIICVFAIALIIITGLFGSVVPQLVSETRDLVVKIPAYSKRLQERVEEWVEHPPDFLRNFLKRAPASTPSLPTESGSTTNAVQTTVAGTNAPPVASDSEKPGRLTDSLDQETLQSAATWVAQALPGIGSWLFGQVSKVASWFGVLAGLALIPIYTFYLLLEKRAIESKWTDYLPVASSGFKDELVFVLKSINNYLIAFFRGQVLVAICDGILYTIGFLIIGLPYAIVIGAMATVLTMIPFLGAIVTCITALIIALVSFGDWQHPLLVLAVVAVVQALEGLVIQPRIMGERVGLHPLTIIIAVMAGTTLLGGLLGGILAIPLTAALRVIMFRYVWKKRSAA
jgi:predicted PurR-regulated permease PerM